MKPLIIANWKMNKTNWLRSAEKSAGTFVGFASLKPTNSIAKQLLPKVDKEEFLIAVVDTQFQVLRQCFALSSTEGVE